MIAWALGKHKQCLIIASALRIIIEREKKTVVFLTKLKYTAKIWPKYKFYVPTDNKAMCNSLDTHILFCLPTSAWSNSDHKLNGHSVRIYSMSVVMIAA